MVTDKLFTELFRPKQLAGLVLPKRVLSELSNGLVQNTLLYSSSPGTGKSTITKILSEGYDTLFINASAERGIDVIREQITTFASTYSFDSQHAHKVIVLEEMDGLTKDSFDALRSVIEKYADSVRFIGNCNNINKIPDAIQSRFNCIPMYPINKEEEAYVYKGYCVYVGKILSHKTINIAYTPEALNEFVSSYFPDMRSLLNTIQSLHNSGCKELDMNSIIKTFDCSDLFESIFTSTDPVKNYTKVMSEYSSNIDETMLTFSKNFVDFICVTKKDKLDKIPMVIITIAEYMSMMKDATDKVIVLLAMIYKLQILVQ